MIDKNIMVGAKSAALLNTNGIRYTAAESSLISTLCESNLQIYQEQIRN